MNDKEKQSKLIDISTQLLNLANNIDNTELLDQAKIIDDCVMKLETMKCFLRKEYQDIVAKAMGMEHIPVWEKNDVR